MKQSETHTEVPAPTRVGRGSSGLGLFAETSIAKGGFIIEYTGERITVDEADMRGGQYLFQVTDTLTIDGRDRSNKARYINHSCKPNAEAEHLEDGDRIFIRAKKSIKPGEEITYHYGKEFFETYIKPKGCRCIKCATPGKI
ncbi:hypothetical protein A3C87_00755 [Candidatus Kaiserbacteria bacterium RIFCSPHIGHO2_02_FULL_49_34]|uniref:SET domain-containing protein n=1 Tax=Candidatus Kaiserbacteria bacterium RIFCSPHIGHO2_02_FULL_49_34 TaxID=1798491 RepID=A0A1F6DKF4_9BACT|nr:MAG: hypothetical protein A3C87_00755 [Candidatus Kaiserbacteria bacterium RIFCSPHIGHO2_02_FULL_49_34]